MPNFGENPVEPGQVRGQRRAISDLIEIARSRLHWHDLGVRRRTAVSWSFYATLAGLACTIIFVAQGRYEDAGPFAGITLVLAVASVAIHVALLKLRRRSDCLLYGFAAVGGSVAFTTVAITSRTTSNVASTLALLPPLVGSWFALHWVARLTARRLTGVDLADATTTVRGTAAIWCVVLVLAVAGAPFASAGHTPSLVTELSDGLAGIFSVAAIFTYAGPGWTEYQRGLAASSKGVSVNDELAEARED